MVHCSVKLPYSVETDPASQSAAQTHTIARDNLPPRLAVHICKNVPIIYPLPLRSAEQLERFGESEDITDLLFEVAIEIAIHRNLRDEIERGIIP